MNTGIVLAKLGHFAPEQVAGKVKGAHLIMDQQAKPFFWPVGRTLGGVRHAPFCAATRQVDPMHIPALNGISSVIIADPQG